METFIGHIMLWPAPYAPQGWAICDGSLLQIQQYAALYAVIGNRFPGGDGVRTFALPDLRNRFPMGSTQLGQPPETGGSTTSPVTVAGNADFTLTPANMPSHNHTASFKPGSGAAVSIAIPADNTGSSDNVPAAGLVLGKPAMGASAVKTYSGNNANTTLKPFDVTVPAGGGTVTTELSGDGKPVSVPVSLQGTASTLPPFITMNFIIALEGLFPRAHSPCAARIGQLLLAAPGKRLTGINSYVQHI
ncbi:phage tail protein [Pseudoduganella plicata]|uniref:Phage tail protein n=2 Tax=Pseudoduganella plicata TaxID=321984 RepID=A0ABX5S9B4_9BURK|nr:phage tail protein [Pseudoduganella plicata]